MSAFGTKQTSQLTQRMSAFGGKADIGWMLLSDTHSHTPISLHVLGQARALPVPMIVFANGGPDGSIATMPLTRFGRASAMSHPNGPDCEWVKTIAGPILSRSAAPASWLRCWVSSFDSTVSTCVA